MTRQYLKDIFLDSLRVEKKFASAKSFGTPAVLFLSVDPKTNNYVIGASSLRFPSKFGKEIYQVHYEKRQAELVGIPGNRKKRRTLRKLVRLGEKVDKPRYYIGHPGEAFELPTFELKAPCAKCAKIYGFVTTASDKGVHANKFLNCAEDAWVLKAKL
jgi:hypothetical protein